MKIFRVIILCIVLLCSVSFFTVAILGETIVSNIELLGAFILVAIVLINATLVPKEPMVRHFSSVFPLLFIAVFISTIACYLINGQPVLYSIIAARTLFYYLLYYVLHILKPSRQQLFTLIFSATLIYFLVYSVQYFVYPTELVLSRMKPDRAKVRINLPGSAFLLFTIVYCTYASIFLKAKLRMLMTSLLGSLFLVFLSTRILIAATFLTQAIIFFQQKGKGLVIFFFVGCVFVFVVPPVINAIDPQLIEGLVNRTKNDSEKAEDYIRVQAFQYYFGKMKKEPVTFIVGNGQPTGGKNFASAYSEQTNYEKELGFFLDDLGHFGAFYRYGFFYLVFLIALLVKVWRVLKAKELDDFQRQHVRLELGFVKYYMFLLTLVSITIPLFITNGDAIISICICLYLVDYEIANAGNVNEEDDEQAIL